MSAPDLPVVDGLRLPAELRALLRPDELLADVTGRQHRLPRFFYEIASWSQAKDWSLTPHFRLSELLIVDSREAGRLLDDFPHYVPCAVTLLARVLEDLRVKVGAPVFVAANGGYRSPAHGLSTIGNPHLWATGADIYRIGDTWLNSSASIEKYGAIAREVLPNINTLPFGHDRGETDDHLHVDLGYLRAVPAGCDEATPG